MVYHKSDYLRDHFPPISKRLFREAPAPVQPQMTEQVVRSSEVNPTDRVELNRSRELGALAASILEQRGVAVFEAAQKAKKAPVPGSPESKLYACGQIARLSNTAETAPAGKAERTPNPIPIDRNPMILRVKKDGNGFVIALPGEPSDGELKITSLNGRNGDLIQCCGTTKEGDIEVPGAFQIPINEIMLHQLSQEGDSILADSGSGALTEKQKAVLNLQRKAKEHGTSSLRTPESATTLIEGASDSGKISRSTLEAFASERNIPPATIEKILGSSAIPSTEVTMQVFEAAGMFDPHVANAFAKEAGAQVQASEERVTSLSKTIAELNTKIDTYPVGSKITDEAGAEIDVTDTMVDQWKADQVALHDKLTTARGELAEATREQSKYQELAKMASKPENKKLVTDLLNDVATGKMDQVDAKAFIKALEKNDANGMIDVVINRELKKVAEGAERDALKKKLEERRKKINSVALSVGGIALLLILQSFTQGASGK